MHTSRTPFVDLELVAVVLGLDEEGGGQEEELCLPVPLALRAEVDVAAGVVVVRHPDVDGLSVRVDPLCMELHFAAFEEHGRGGALDAHWVGF